MGKINKKERKFNEETLLVTVDIGKKFNYGYARTKDGQELEVFKFFNTGKGFEYFLKKVESFRAKTGLKNCLFGLESTGSYGLALIHYLHRRGYEIVQINPMHTKRLKELTDNSPNKTDKKDPKVIADIIELNKYLTVIIPEGIFAELRELVHLREKILEDLRRSYNRIEGQLFKIFPEFSQVMRDLTTKTSRYLLAHYTLPQFILDLGLTKLTELIKSVSKNRLGEEKALALYEAAKMSGGIKEGTRSIVMEIKIHLDQIDRLESYQKSLKDEIENYLKEVPYSRNILSIKGIGPIIAAILIGELGDIRRYKSYRELEKIAGLNLYEVSSGQHKGKHHISKRGRSLLRKALFI
ncbi:IS110 family transposase [Caldithrix abyssi]|uniref:IS110 family transposase n=1 Tax=Caldithrix abyssi TaxID=187145 RepID=UPI00031E0053|nr:IS110 family transposase [Caldithrix abyssi]